MLHDRTKAVFDSRNDKFKHPGGPVKKGESLTLTLLLAPELAAHQVSMVIQNDRTGKRRSFPMEAEETPQETDAYIRYRVAVRLPEAGLFWYDFVVETETGTLYVGKAAKGAKGELTRDRSMWQQTVYERQYQVPDWIYGGVFYHIFVDRFHASGRRIPLPGKINRDDWGGLPAYMPDAERRILNNDFFGGDLAGIIQKLDYLQDLGVTCLYLSPIFEAYSNHKYDTADYLHIDPMFGNEEDFRTLCREAARRGMRVILDGVFSHTGSDSRYFNRYGHYGPGGAYRDPSSPYRSWYYIKEDGTYETWWGIDTLPRLDKTDKSYRAFVCGEKGVIRHWLREGASGWRLDVADELPNSFLRELCRAAHSEKADALIIGEVWEDASNKVAYDERKNYFKGDRLDSVMNYPVRKALVDFVRRGAAEALSEAVEEILANYPPEVVHCTMNLLGTHDTERILTALGGREGRWLSKEEQATERLNPAAYREARKMLMIAVLLQMTLPGVPCIYYGDEAGMEGYKDPFNRSCFPWGKEDKVLQGWYKKIIAFRKSHPLYRQGAYRTVAAIHGLYAFERYYAGERIITAANCGLHEETLILAGRKQDAITGDIYKNNITIVPGQALLLTEA